MGTSGRDGVLGGGQDGRSWRSRGGLPGGGGPWVEPRGTVRPWLDGEVVRGHSCWGGMSHTLDTHLPSERSPMWPECQAPWEELAHLQGQEVHHPTANPAPPYIPGL